MRNNSHTHYGSVAKSLHWATVALILTLIPSGIIANGLPFDTSEELARKATLFSLHKTLGVTLFFLALIRILWALSQPHPVLLNGEKALEAFLARTVHWLLYGSLLIVPLSGWTHHAATEGFAPIWWPFGQNLPFVPKSEALAHLTAGLHIVFERVLVFALFLHIAGALKHHLIDRDVTLKRMLPGTPDVPQTAPTCGGFAPIIGAVGIWVAALGIGAGLGVFGHAAETPARAELDTVASDWQVQDGEIAISVSQLGSTIGGRFDDWTAAIAYDPETGTGTADVQIAITSLTLGSVTDQALGADYFDASQFPVAQVTGTIGRDNTGHTLTGTITIKGMSAPLSLPFDLALEGNSASATGQVTLDRRDFAIGESQKDEGTVGFAVVVDISLTASR